MEDLERDVEVFIRNYVSALEKLVKENRKQIESIDVKPWFPTEFPVKAVGYLIKRGIIIHFEKADCFEVSTKNNERPHRRSRWGEFIHYPRFSRIKERASEKAESDIKYLLNLPKMIEEHERQMERYDEALWIEEMSYDTEHYVEFLNKAKEVVAETKLAAMQEVYDIIKVIQNHISNFEYMLRVGCKALDHLYFMINSDLETSFFLALNGKYFAALAIMRKILEVNVRSAYLDNLQDRALAEKETDDWISGGRFPFRFSDIVDNLISDRIDHSLTDLLKKLGSSENGSFRQSIVSLYAELCLFIHLRPQPPTPWDDLKISFSEFNLEKFRSYYLLFMKVMKVSEILLVLKFPRVISTPSLAEPSETYRGLILSGSELDTIAKFAFQTCSDSSDDV